MAGKMELTPEQMAEIAEMQKKVVKLTCGAFFCYIAALRVGKWTSRGTGDMGRDLELS